MRKQSLSIISAFMISAVLLIGCGDNAPVSDNAAPETTEAPEAAASEDKQTVSQLEWIELGNLETNQGLRDELNTIFGVTGDVGSRQGSIYETPDETTDSYDNNNTLDIALHNYNVRVVLDNDAETIAEAARNNFIDLEDEDDTTAIASAINSYFNLLPDTDDGNSNPNETLTRAQAMAAIMRAITPVSDDLQSDTTFESAVGTSEYNIFAQSLNDSAFLNTTDGSLDTISYTGKMTRGEAIYLLMNKFFPDAMKEDNASKYPGLTFDDCINGGEYTADSNASILKQMLDESSTHKVDSRIYNAMVLASNYMILDSKETNWDAAITKAEFIDLLVRTLREETSTMERFNAPDNVVDITEEEYENYQEDPYNPPTGIVNAYEHQDQMPKPTDYGVSIKTMDDLPTATMFGWDFEKHPIWYGYTDKNFQVVYDPTTDLCYYANMMLPTGDLFGSTKEGLAMDKVMTEKGYNTCFEITYEEAVQLFGKPDMSTMSTSDWASGEYEANKVNK